MAATGKESSCIDPSSLSLGLHPLPACSGQTQLTQTYEGVQVTLLSLERSKEFKAFKGFPAERRFAAGLGNDLVVCSLKASKSIDFKSPTLEPRISAVGDGSYTQIYSHALGFQDGHAEATILFEIPEGKEVKHFALGALTFDVTKLPRHVK